MSSFFSVPLPSHSTFLSIWKIHHLTTLDQLANMLPVTLTLSLLSLFHFCFLSFPLLLLMHTLAPWAPGPPLEPAAPCIDRQYGISYSDGCSFSQTYTWSSWSICSLSSCSTLKHNKWLNESISIKAFLQLYIHKNRYNPFYIYKDNKAIKIPMLAQAV